MKEFDFRWCPGNGILDPHECGRGSCDGCEEVRRAEAIGDADVAQASTPLCAWLLAQKKDKDG